MFDLVCFIQDLVEKFLSRSTFVLGRGFGSCELKKSISLSKRQSKRQCEKNDEIGEGLKGRSRRDPLLPVSS